MTYRIWAPQISAVSAAILAEQERSRADARQLINTGFSGAAADAAASRLLRLSDPLAEMHEKTARVATILREAAALQSLLDDFRDRVIHAAALLGDANPGIALTLLGINAAAAELDKACAAAIVSVCGPDQGIYGRRLGDSPYASLDEIHASLEPQAPPEVQQLLRDNPDLRLLELPDGGLVAAIGDPDTADVVTTFVAGVHSSDPAGWPAQVHHTRMLAEAAIPPGATGAGIVWLGYRAPSSVSTAVAQTPAREAGANLATFQRSLAQRNPDAHRVVVGYSYGTVVAGHAAAEQALWADDLVFVASPGVGASHASDLHLVGVDPQVHAVTADGDPIDLAVTGAGGVHGIDPTSREFGARVWRYPGHGDHGEYFRTRDLADLMRDQIGSRVDF